MTVPRVQAVLLKAGRQVSSVCVTLEGESMLSGFEQSVVPVARDGSMSVSQTLALPALPVEGDGIRIYKGALLISKNCLHS